MKGRSPSGITPEALTRDHDSVTRNPILAEVFYRVGLIEKWGRGTNRVVAQCRQAGTAPPEFEFDEDHSYFMVRLPIHPAALEVVESVTGEATGAVVTPPVTPPVRRLLVLLSAKGDLGNAQIRGELGLKDRKHLREVYIEPALVAGLIEYTLPGKPNSRLQQYRLTPQGRDWLTAHQGRGAP